MAQKVLDNSKFIILEDIPVDGLLYDNSCGSNANDGSTLSHYYSQFSEEFSLDDVGCSELIQDDTNLSSNGSLPIEFKFSESEQDMIIDAVRSRQGLWNIRCLEFKNKNLKTRLWEEVATDINIEVNPFNILMVRKQWDSLKATYTRSKKRVASGSAGGIKEYKFAKRLSFLDDTAAPRESTEVCGSCSPSPPPPIEPGSKNLKRKGSTSYQEENLQLKRRFISAVEGKMEDSTDMELESFWGMLKPYLKPLRMLSRLQAQQDILKVVSDALQKQGNT